MPDASSQQVWRFAIMFQIGMILVGLVLLAIPIFTGRGVIGLVLGICFITVAALGIVYSRVQLSRLRER